MNANLCELFEQFECNLHNTQTRKLFKFLCVSKHIAFIQTFPFFRRRAKGPTTFPSGLIFKPILMNVTLIFMRYKVHTHLFYGTLSARGFEWIVRRKHSCKHISTHFQNIRAVFFYPTWESARRSKSQIDRICGAEIKKYPKLVHINRILWKFGTACLQICLWCPCEFRSGYLAPWIMYFYAQNIRTAVLHRSSRSPSAYLNSK